MLTTKVSFNHKTEKTHPGSLGLLWYKIIKSYIFINNLLGWLLIQVFLMRGADLPSDGEGLEGWKARKNLPFPVHIHCAIIV